MEKITSIIVLLFGFSFGVYSQNESPPQPKNINEAIQFLMKDCPDSLKSAIKKNKDDTLINFIKPWSTNLHAYSGIAEWTGSNFDNKTEIEKYYANLGITYGVHIEAIILISFKNYLNSGHTDHEQVIKPFQQIEEKWNNEDKVRFTTDSLRGVYIPKDMDDCFKQIDKFWSDSTKSKVRRMTEEQFTAGAHLGFGTWMRNNWQLWGGSRLTKYFNDRGVYYPESISGVILTSYYRYLTGQPIKFNDQVKLDQDYWKVVKEPAKNTFPKNSGNLVFNTGFYYDSKKNGQGFIHVGTRPDSKDIWIYDYYFGWAKITEAQLSELKNEDTREEILIKIFKMKQ